MINDLQGTWFWAIAPGGMFTWTVTFNYPASDIVAEASLAKIAGISGPGSAMAYLQGWSWQNPGGAGLPPTGAFRTPSPDQAPAFRTLLQSTSVTFGLTVNNQFAAATAKVYFV